MRTVPQFYQSLLLCFSFILFIGCNSDDENPIPAAEGAYSNAIFIVNEGNFGVDNSSISAYFPEEDSVANNIFFIENQRELGNTAQSMFVNDTLAYIIVNASNKMEVVSANTFRSKGGIEEGLANPRYFTTLNNKGYITNWGNFQTTPPESPFIAVVDLTTLEITDTVQTGNGPENIIAVDDKIFFTNNFGNTLGILDPATLEVTEVELTASPSAMVIDADGDLWVIAGGEFGANQGKIFEINVAEESVKKTIDLNLAPLGKLVTNPAKDKLFYAAGTAVYQMATNATSAPATPFITNEDGTGFYGLGFDPGKNELYVGDANGFQGSGSVFRYSLDGSLLGSFDTGIAPNGFIFN